MNAQAAPKTILKEYFGYDDFRENQLEIIEAVLGGKDAFVLMPTGSGKSICYQIPAILCQGMGIIISPLIALMEDQVKALKQNGVKAAYLNSTLPFQEMQRVQRSAAEGLLDVLYVAPERFLTSDFQHFLTHLTPGLFAIDEAHCVSQWGHDFRPEYLRINEVTRQYPNTPRIALTATADAVTRKEIMQHHIYTIGHSTYTVDIFVEMLRQHGITAIGDVRSSPYSRYNPQFNRETLQAELKKQGISYVYLGRELGPRSDDPGCYEEGRVRYNKLAKTAFFQEGIRRLKEGMKSFRIALMCAEKDPVVCHRTILVCRELERHDFRIGHILEDGSVEDHTDAMKRLRELLKLPELDMFTTPGQMIKRAYDLQGRKIAYVKNEENGESS